MEVSYDSFMFGQGESQLLVGPEICCREHPLYMSRLGCPSTNYFTLFFFLYMFSFSTEVFELSIRLRGKNKLYDVMIKI